MFYIQSLILKPNKKIKDLSDLKKNVDDYFVPLNNTGELKNMKSQLDPNYLSGAIILKYGEQELLDVTMWDLIDQLWAYFLNLIEEAIETGKSETYFPDQPLLLKMKSISNDMLLFEIDQKQKVLLPKLDFFETLLKNAKGFFETMISFLEENCDYDYELNKIDELQTKIKCV
ncbi:hypothetical protein ABEX89_14690 [Bacillus velezensis]|uniref:hypothetical protein n=1 Tax=Bacillus amyloliquefaciens group TaxID=1938374 RepID=UPI000A17D52E|nr:hypothetical protein [Bacillus velezensis]ARJ73936.1 hypothetical protein B7941_05135 [Bacillus velezensis]MCP1534835.1 hypothetical protein [Bacillus velezensis]MEC3665322.1 hypothetical protein [Bacillus velezensis]